MLFNYITKDNLLTIICEYCNKCKIFQFVLHFITFYVDTLFRMVYYTVTNIQSNDQDTTLKIPGKREYQIW